MAPALEPSLIGREMAACGLLGAVLGSLRAVFPEKSRAAFLPDVLFVGTLLLGLQAYAASLSFCGVLRWYQLAAALVGARLAGTLLRWPMREVRFVLGIPVRGLQRWAGWVFRKRNARKIRLKERRNAKRTAKNQKKNLPRPQRMLYNSNVSK